MLCTEHFGHLSEHAAAAHADEQIGESAFAIEDITYDLHASEFNAENLRTEYEENFSAKGFKINYLKAANKK